MPLECEGPPLQEDSYTANENTTDSIDVVRHRRPGWFPGRGRYLVGPAARYTLNRRWLSPLAREAADAAGLGEQCRNPYRSILVRAVEVVYAVEEALRLIETYEPPTRPAVVPSELTIIRILPCRKLASLV